MVLTKNELIYLTIMGPALLQAAKAGTFDVAAWAGAEQAAAARDFDQTLEALWAGVDAPAAV